MQTHTCMHACIHAHTHSHTHTHAGPGEVMRMSAAVLVEAVMPKALSLSESSIVCTHGAARGASVAGTNGQ